MGADPLPGNVLFVTLDQWRGDCLSARGHPLVRTPALDGLAATGVLFANHWAQSAPCGPSRACLYTGTYQLTNRVVGNGCPLDDRLTNVARQARDAGYDPVLFGYTDQSVDPRTVPPDDPRLFSYEGVLSGFESLVDFRPQSLQPWIGWLAGLGYDIPDDPQAIFDGDPRVPGAPDHRASWAPPVYAAEHSHTAFLVDHLLGWLDARPHDERWFAHLSLLGPHPPYRAPAPYHDRYDPTDVVLPVRAATREQEPRHPLADLVSGVAGVAAPDDDEELRQITATYYGMVTEVDGQLGRVLAWLDDHGQADRTLVVVTSDHGEQLGSHWLMEKLGWWDESYHVPLIVRDPRADPATRGRQVQAATEHVDVLPTILEWLGRPVPRQCDGCSLLPFWAEADGPPDGAAPAGWRTEAHWQWDFSDPVNGLAEAAFGIPSGACTLDVLRGPRWKYVQFGGLPSLLFDLQEDPEQLVDRAADPACAGVVAACAQRLLSWRMAHADRTLTGYRVTRRGLLGHG